MRLAVVNPNTTASMTAKIAAAAEARGVAGHRDRREDLVDGTGLDRGLLRRGAVGARAVRRARQGRAERVPMRRSSPASTTPASMRRAALCDIPVHRHLRGGGDDGRVPRQALHRRHDARPVARPDRGALPPLRHGGPRAWCGRRTFRCSSLEDPNSGARDRLRTRSAAAHRRGLRRSDRPRLRRHGRPRPHAAGASSACR